MPHTSLDNLSPRGHHVGSLVPLTQRVPQPVTEKFSDGPVTNQVGVDVVLDGLHAVVRHAVGPFTGVHILQQKLVLTSGCNLFGVELLRHRQTTPSQPYLRLRVCPPLPSPWAHPGARAHTHPTGGRTPHPGPRRNPTPHQTS